ncbi:siderophore-interacting protein [Actinoallomurus purpureus]|uniref:siderophore-interacting protein n=1 Tax=Actinoallomurus purpureus TaxID=478114 RepID=UPI0020926931|nr:siderophore-interacting protein [Actinoallomurus purpureus]MCO6005586.1 siderophore-interacting protein [Actinoallomurus purpureus]
MTNDTPVRQGRRLNHGRVRRTEWLTPHMIRVVIGGEELDGFPAGACTDHYVKILFPVPGVAYPEPFDMEAVRRDLPRDQWPRTRAYTVRSWDPEAQELTIDFVHHGDHGLAGPWAARAKPGEDVLFMGPGGAYAPSEKADWHLLVGDESALPAIAASLERLPEGTPARVFVEVADAEDELPLGTAGDARIVWLHRGDAEVGDALVEAVHDLEFPPGEVHAFVHGEAGFVKRLRRHLRVERGLSLDQLSISGYWRRGTDDEGWRASKAEWNRRVEEEEVAATA